MTIASTRAQAVAEILWELKRAEKLATLTSIANRVGFSPGSGGRTVNNCLKTVRRDWSHLQWWRAVPDDGVVDKEQAELLAEGGFATEPIDEETATVKSLEAQLMNWDEPEEQDENESATDESE